MKKYALPILLCVVAVLFASCSVPYTFAQDMSDLDNIKIEIVNLECSMGYHSGEPYDEEKVTVISVIEDREKEAFLADFEKIKSYQPNFGSRIDSIYGKAIRITYADGEIELITHYGTATVNNGKIWNQTTTFDSEAFAELLNKYI